MKRRRISILVILVLLLGIGTISSTNSVVAAKKLPTQERSFTVKAILPNNQTTNQETFFDLQTKPKQKQRLQLLVSNIGKKPLDIKVQLNDAYTSGNGIISYDRPKVKLYKPQNPALTELINGKRTYHVHVKPQYSKIVTFTYQAPKTEFNGIILGAIVATAGVSSSKKSEFAIQNQVQYVTGVVLRSKKDTVKPAITMGKHVIATTRSQQTGLGFTLYNAAPINVSQMKMTSSVKRKGNSKVITKKLRNLQMAPSSTWNVLLPQNKIHPGSYTLTLHLQAKNHYHKTFVRHFTVTKANANAIKKATQPKHYNRLLPWIFIGLVLIIVLGLLYLLWIYLKGQNKNGRS